jgi:hypothetical protein
MKKIEYEIGDTVWYQPRGKGTRKKQALIYQIRGDGCYWAVCEGKFYYVGLDQIAGLKRKGKK